ncbi:Glycoside hydrolase family 32 [Penicillium macrosclerotiorum]|uniref:Glycoside hydrolase family 32 n=1 Tax=Penicillium macrosclerotiorum TaxID=303699 RepID=UPI0025477B0C|nr:Glycoside hydrolase family 32 [Penicillium macrosclerotiorum]KAJ5675925.1 Glycoside hydrolase family 32 [Penicillium macrosclerotiorum]
MSWGHAVSSDLISWEKYSMPALTPSAEYDCRGIFTGCLSATDLHGNFSGALTALYTSVRHLPIHYTLPYTTGSESLSLAVSGDGGKTWERQSCNPILPGPPQGLSVTGWRDPYLTNWARQQPDHPSNCQAPLYGFISGGIVGHGPNIFVYTVNPTDLRQWQYAGPLVSVGSNFHPSRWSGDFGLNWEVGNFTTLSNDLGHSRDFAIMGAEGCLRSENSDWTRPGSARERRSARSLLWMSVNSTEENNDEALSKYNFGGIFDHGCLYAANSFWDAQTSQRIVYGWVTEEDLPDGPRHSQGWSGMISLPRVIRLLSLERVKKARNSPLESITSIEVMRDPAHPDTFTIHTLGISPESRLANLREGAKVRELQDLPFPTKLASPVDSNLPLTNRWELEAEVSVGQLCQRVGIEIAHNIDFSHCTTLAWDPCNETFTVHRPPVEDKEINHGYESAPHTLFTLVNEQGEEVEETLHVHAFFDKSVLEVFVNGRTVITTRIYSPSDQCFGIRFIAEANENSLAEQPARLVRANVWDGLKGE